MPSASPEGTIPHSLFSFTFGTINNTEISYDFEPEDITFGQDTQKDIMINGKGQGYIDKAQISKPTVEFNAKGVTGRLDLKPLKDLQYDQIMRKLNQQNTGLDLELDGYKIFALTIMNTVQSAPQWFGDILHFEQIQISTVGRYYQV